MRKESEPRKLIRDFLSRINGNSFKTGDVVSETGLAPSVVSSFLSELRGKGVLATSGGQRSMLFTKVKTEIHPPSGIKRGVTREVTGAYNKIVAAINARLGQWFHGQQIVTASGVSLPVVCVFVRSYFANGQLERKGGCHAYEYRAMAMITIDRQPVAAVSEAVWSVVANWVGAFTPGEVIDSLLKQQKPANANSVKAILRRWYYCGYLELLTANTYRLKPGVTTRPVSSSRKENLFHPEQIGT